MKSVYKQRQERGQALVELALTAPVIFLILAGLVHFGMVMHAEQTITNASRVGARAAGQGYDESGVREAVLNYCEEAGLDPTKVGDDIDMGSCSGCDIRVTVTYEFSSPVQGLLSSMSAMITGQPMEFDDLEATTVMRR